MTKEKMETCLGSKLNYIQDAFQKAQAEISFQAGYNKRVTEDMIGTKNAEPNISEEKQNE